MSMSPNSAPSYAPKRVQMTRHQPWRTAHPGAVIVDRRTRWGNPIRVGASIPRVLIRRIDERMTALGFDQEFVVVVDAEDAVGLYELWLAEQPELLALVRRDLAGRDLACWCPLTDAEGRPVPCHADVLLQVANTSAWIHTAWPVAQPRWVKGRYEGHA